MQQKIYHILLFLIISYTSHAQYKFEYNVRQAALYNKISALKLSEASADVFTELNKDPNNLSTIHLANYIDFYELFFSENPATYAKQKGSQDKRITLLNKLPDTNPNKTYAKAVQYFQWALVKIKFKDYLSAAADLRASYLMFKENQLKFPKFGQSLAYIGAIETVVGTIPSKYRWLANIIGLKGNVKTGVSLVEKAMAAPNKQYPIDVMFLYVYIKQYFSNQPEQALSMLQSVASQSANNRLITFMIANITLNQNKADATIAVIMDNKNKLGFLEIPMLDYELGTAYMYQLNDKCITYLQQFIRNSKGKFYIKDTYYKMSLYAYMQGKKVEAEKYRLAIHSSGNTETDADKSAEKFYENPSYSHPELLKARFQCDGGYFMAALLIMQKLPVSSMVSPLQQLEYNYRLGRIFHDLNRYEEAVKAYDLAIKLGADKTAYFASRAALECGKIYEKQNNKPLAAQYYNKCLAMDDHDYKSSIDQQAKTGMQRIGY